MKPATAALRLAGLLAASCSLADAAALLEAQPLSPPPTAAEADRIRREAGPSGPAEAPLREELRVLDAGLDAQPGSYELLWRAARAQNELGTKLEGDAKKQAFDEAIAFAQRAVAAREPGVEGHYWLGASYGRAAEARGGLKAFFMARKLRREMEAVLRLQPSYEGGDAFLALGELDRGLPGFLGGDKDRGRRYLEQGLKLAPDNADLMLALARAYIDAHRQDDARLLLQALVAPEPSRPPPDASIVREARELLESLAARAPAPRS